MAIALVSGQTAVGGSFTTTLNVAFPSDNTAGSLLVYAAGGIGNNPTITDSNNTPVQLVSEFFNGDTLSEIHYVQNCSAGANTVSHTTGGEIERSMIISEYSGAATTGVADGSSSSSGYSNSPASGTVATTEAGEMYWGTASSGYSPITWSESTGFTLTAEGGDARPIHAQHRIGPSHPTTDESDQGMNTGANWTCCVGLFKEAAGGGGGTILPQMLHHHGG